jgi:FkbM family methyltransferase
MTLLHRLLGRVGLEVHWRRNLEAARQRERQKKRLRPWELLRQYEIATVIDVGANVGQFAVLMRELLPEARVWSFEPLPDVFASLESRFAEDSLVTALPYALSDHEGEALIQRSAFSPSSSLLPMAELHQREWPLSADCSEVEVQLRTLDGLLRQEVITPKGNVMVKLDVQGHEDAVIRGGQQLLASARVVIVEVSFEPLYHGQPLFADIYTLLSRLGFIYRGSLDQHFSPTLNRFLFADAVFENVATK